MQLRVWWDEKQLPVSRDGIRHRPELERHRSLPLQQESSPFPVSQGPGPSPGLWEWGHLAETRWRTWSRSPVSRNPGPRPEE